MKILHTADLHLGVKNSKLSLEKQALLKSENTMMVEQLFKNAYNQDYDVVLICGDLFHSKNIASKIRTSFFDAVKEFSRPVIYIRGNHDEKFEYKNTPENFIILDELNPCYTIGDVIFWAPIEETVIKQSFDENKTNILMLHGNIENQADNDFIDIEPYLHTPFDYVAMGHIHQFKPMNIMGKIFVYPGCLLSNGFDECGERGYVDVFVSGKKIKYNFVSFAKRKYMICDVDITDSNSISSIIEKIKETLSEQKCEKQDLIRIVLNGYFDEETDKNISLIQEELDDYFYIEIEDKSKIKIDINQYKNEQLSFKAEFIRLVEEQGDLDEQQKNLICQLGIEALKGDDLSI